MKVTNVKVYSISGNPSLVALADIVLDGGLSVSDLRIVRLHGDHMIVQYPVSQHSSSANVRHICNPINRETQQAIEDAVLDAYRKLKEQTL